MQQAGIFEASTGGDPPGLGPQAKMEQRSVGKASAAQEEASSKG